ncbi:TenA family transcriptional regulator [Serratia fonticola]|uniref:Heme oxygenase n=1 Tax=Serratia fonticola TaxID=47917 RepID=A0A0F7H8Q8_SERFO|nr:iron-containing redox enzyme family protein [Serratia fonticola]AKG68429.1 long-chain fatty acid--CoA ligase [Serratia fonticola]MBL5828627.1 iron-containing redox enzyme family protein [Serratia fonticola]MBL5863535.1 iron-containing redox enzyme family protein [Serratia fonticola]CAI1546614.1 Heme oxygenase [Serratia fonticola]CAI1745215.1 Heme oxygenase [Serratia fonticola]
MSFYQLLQRETAVDREKLLSAPVIEACRCGNINAAMYIAFLTQAFYHVSHTVPLLMTAGGRMNSEYEWVRGAIAEYIDEEYGHQEWILNDIRTCGGDAEAVRHGQPVLAIELMIAFLYDHISRLNPMGIFGMVHVLEGTSVAIATTVAEQLKQGLGLPEKAMSYLSSHGELDKEHLAFFASLMDQVEKSEDRAAIIHTAKVVYQLYGDMLRGLMEPAQ